MHLDFSLCPAHQFFSGLLLPVTKPFRPFLYLIFLSFSTPIYELFPRGLTLAKTAFNFWLGLVILFVSVYRTLALVSLDELDSTLPLTRVTAPLGEGSCL